MRVLVTTDGSPLSERALAAIAPWVRRWNAETWLLTVVDPRATHEVLAGPARPAAPATGLSAPPPPRGVPATPAISLAADRGQVIETARAAVEDQLRELAAHHFPGMEVGVRAAFSTDAAEAIDNFAQDRGVDFIVLSTRGRSGLGHALFGSVSGAVVRRSTVPVIVVGPECEVPGAA